MNTSCTRSLASKALYFNMLTHCPALHAWYPSSSSGVDGAQHMQHLRWRMRGASLQNKTHVASELPSSNQCHCNEVILALLLRHNDPVRHANILRIVIFGGALLSSSTFHPHPLFPSPPHYKHPPPGANEGQTGLLDVGEKTYVLE